MIHEDTIQKLIDLKLNAMANAARELANAAPSKDLSTNEVLGMIVDREHLHRDNRRLARRMKEARLPPNAACVEEVTCETARGLDKAVVRALSTCNWVRAKQNVIVVGATGTGKTFLGTALAQAACRAGFRALSTRTPRRTRTAMDAVRDRLRPGPLGAWRDTEQTGGRSEWTRSRAAATPRRSPGATACARAR